VSDIGASPGAIVNPFLGYAFKLIFPDGETVGHFTRVHGLGMNVQTIRYREGGAGPTVRHLPGLLEYTPVTLSYGLTNSRLLLDWIQAVARGGQGANLRKHISIVMLAEDDSTERTRFDLLRAWPTSWQGSFLDALSSEAAIEHLTLVYDELVRR
jgi:phage tail-like protein